MWTPTTRKQHIRETNRYQTDVTDEEWRVMEPYLPAAKSTGRPRTGRYGRAWPRARTASGEHPGSRWWRAATASFASHLPIHPAGLRRQRICRREGRHGHVDRGRDRAQEPRPGWLRRSTAALGRRTVFAWIGRNRRLAKDFEATFNSARAFLYAASVMLLVRRIARTS